MIGLRPPVAEQRQHSRKSLRLEVPLAQPADRLHGLAHLIQVGPAPVTFEDMGFEVGPGCGREAVLHVVSHELDELLTFHIGGDHLRIPPTELPAIHVRWTARDVGERADWLR